jgi:hypothetical protein
MTKGRVEDFLGLYRAILTDVAAYYPECRRGFDKYLVRIESLYASMGRYLFVAALPSLGKVLDRSLEAGRLLCAGEPLTRPINTRTKIPRLFQGLWLRLFAYDGCLRQDVDPSLIWSLRTILFACKKYEAEAPKAALYATVKEYYDVDNSLPEADSIFDSDGTDASLRRWCSLDRDDGRGRLHPDLFGCGERDALLTSVQQVADRVAGAIGEYLPQEHRFRHGPGATAEYPRGKGYKYAFPNWPKRLQTVFPGEVFACANSSLLAGRYGQLGVYPTTEWEPASRLVAVPKTFKAPRLIAAEPTSYQWCQQSVATFLTERIRATYLGQSIDFKRQALSGEAALSASRTLQFATIDLKAASDRLSAWLVMRLFRANTSLLQAMIACRTRYVEQRLDKASPRLHKLRKFSTMGSALTFPVQSIVFWMICVGVGRHLTGEQNIEKLARQVRIYGDDLIVPTDWVPSVVKTLESVFLRVNQDKTFSIGKFRESCGTDAYDGTDVTPLYVTRTHARARSSDSVSLRDLANNAFLKGMWVTSKWLESQLPRIFASAKNLVRPRHSAYGLVTFCGEAYVANRYNSKLHRWEIRQLGMFNPKPSGRRHEGTANLLQYFTEEPDKQILSDWMSGMRAEPDSREGVRWVELPR